MSWDDELFMRAGYRDIMQGVMERAAAERDALRAEVERMRPIVEAAKALKLDPNGTRDWACAECWPTSDILVDGFRCAVHALRYALDAACKPEDE